MIHSPLVTVGIPCYNVERFIGFAIRSVLNQTYTNFELIITDDGSTDSTVDIIKQFDDPRIKLIVDGENHGISYRLNQQIDMAKGEYFVRMDGDDIMFPNRIEEQIKYLQTNPDVSVVSAQAIVIDDNNTIIGKRDDCHELRRLTLRMCISGETLIHPSVMGRLDYFREYYYRNEFKGVEDYDLWIHSCTEKKLDILPVPLMFYRDPFSFKIHTYLFRLKQKRKLYKNVIEENIITKGLYCRLMFQNYLKCAIAYILTIAKLDILMIKRRNSIIEDCKEYQFILDSQI
jgi:glycosyltransferase involved in cell wall biosynthesis